MQAMKLLLELRPALDGHAGIPQASRLLFRGLRRVESLQVEGLIQSSNRLLYTGLPADHGRLARLPAHRRVDQLSRAVVSLQGVTLRGRLHRVVDRLQLAGATVGLTARTLSGFCLRLGRFEPAHFEDFVWRRFFARTLSAEDFPCVTSAPMRIARVPWVAQHASGLLLRKFGATRYPRLDTSGYDALVAETPFPGRVSGRTQLIVRYHDAVPLLMPHTISDRAFHQASHYNALRSNVADRAWFPCVSEASRRDLLAVFPEVEPRTLVIPNVVSHEYFEENGDPARLADIFSVRANTKVAELANRKHPGADHADKGGAGTPANYLLMVSTLEPRKNHLSLLTAWERLRATAFPNLRLVLVGSLGWDSETIVAKLLPWVQRGQALILEDVPANELRLLYRYAAVTVCPSYGEGFGYAGVEAMRCAGVVAASDIPVHREIYGNAAAYFNPYSPEDIGSVIGQLLQPDSAGHREALVDNGRLVAGRYTEECVIGQWNEFLQRMPAAPREG
jgi:glycosyltransferase involved in cell wall biosynthesis